MLASIKQYNPQSVIYSEDKGLLTPVHFVLSGKCQILQCLKMVKKTVKGIQSYELAEMDVTKRRRTQDILEKLKNSTKKLGTKSVIRICL